ncbi:MAG: hypothetical protein ACMVO5_03705 [Polymorphobacter sp.]|uniref:hypothetical protein n=1 Tax=Polymorphobacter sp. TaxID=1909290 RepID=UPI003A8C355C
MLQTAFLILLIGTCLFAFLRGRTDERLAAGGMMLAALITPLAVSSGFASPETGVLGIDVALLTFLFIIALKSDRFWPLWAAGFHVVGTTIHLATFVEVDIWPPAYANAQGFWAWPVLAALFVGTLLEARYRNN